MTYYLPFPDEPVRDPANFIGREREVIQSTALLNQGRSLALVGRQGSGTSSLLIHLLQAMPSLLDEPPATAFIDLADLRSPEELYRSALAALGLQGDDELTLERALQDRRLLLGLDNLDRPGPGFSAPLRSLLRSLIRSGNLQVLAASTRALALTSPDLAVALVEVAVGPLPEREARLMAADFAARAGHEAASAVVGEIVGVAGGYPADLRRAVELWIRSRGGSDFDWRRTFRDEHPERPQLADSLTPLAPRLETEEGQGRFASRLTERVRKAMTEDRNRPNTYELEDISPALFRIAVAGFLALGLVLAPTWPWRIVAVLLLFLLLTVAIPLLGLRSGWRDNEVFQSYLVAVRWFPGARGLIERYTKE